MLLFLYFLALGSIASVPFDRLLTWLYQKGRELSKEVDGPYSPVRFSKRPLILAVIVALNGLLGLGLPYLTDALFYSSFYTGIGILVVFGCYLWPAFNGFSSNSFKILVITGIYAYLFPFTFWLFLLAFCIAWIFTQHYHVSFLIGILCMFLPLWFLPSVPFWVVVNLGLFLVYFLRYSNSVLLYIDSISRKKA